MKFVKYKNETESIFYGQNIEIISTEYKLKT